MKWRRLAYGSYESADGRVAIYRDPTVAGGWYGSSWIAEEVRTQQSVGRHMYRTLREAKAHIAAMQEQTSEGANVTCDPSKEGHSNG